MSDFIASFQQNFIDESRYLYLLQGLGTTLLITAFAAIIGIILGFLVAVIRSTYDQTGKMKFLNAICNVYLTVIRGTPTMVQLLIMYYVIFASSNLNKVVVAFLAFGINSDLVDLPGANLWGHCTECSRIVRIVTKQLQM